MVCPDSKLTLKFFNIEIEKIGNYTGQFLNN